MPAVIQRRLNLNLNLVIGISAVVVVCAVLFVFDPNRAGFYPLCMFHQITGLQCPGCGGLRAMHQLLHGHIAEAFRLNALLVCLLPVAAIYTLQLAIGRFKQQPGRVEFRLVWVWVGLAVLVAFGIGRNLL